MSILLNISMFLISPLMIFMIHIKMAYRMGGGYSNCRKMLIFLLYMLSVNVCTFLVSCARGIGFFHFEQMTISYRFKYMGVGLFFGWLFWVVSLLPKLKIHSVSRRNYELDFMKLFFAICVFISHTSPFHENVSVAFPVEIGRMSVFFFFVTSGMLMAKSIVNDKKHTTEYGKCAVRFVLHKIKAVAWEVYTALFVYLLVYICIVPSKQIPDTLVKSIPELFFITCAGMTINYNGPVWYLSAMFLCMLPLSYLLYRNKDFTTQIFAPILAVFTLGWICQIKKYGFPLADEMRGFFTGSIYFAVSGLCFGICAYNMYLCLCKAKISERGRMLLTVVEIFLYGVFLETRLLSRDHKALMSVILLLPVAIAITFSGKSYIVRLFQFDWMKYFAPISLAIYLNHWIGRVLVQKYFVGKSYWFCVFMMAVFTLCSCLLSTCIKKVGKYMWNNKLKAMLFNYE